MSYLDEYGDPSEDMINDWNIHNDHQDDNEDIDETVYCSNCDKPFTPDWDDDLCNPCAAKYERAHPHPLDIAEAEFQQDQYPDLNDFSSQFYPEGY